MTKLHELFFQRKFSVNPYQTLQLPICEMSMYKDWVNDRRGDPYTVLGRKGDICEEIADASYLLTSAQGGEISRLLGNFFPYYSYSFTVSEIHHASMGVAVCDENGGRRIEILLCDDNRISVRYGNDCQEFPCDVICGDTVIVTFRAGGVSMYVDHGQRPVRIGDLSIPLLEEYLNYDVHVSATCSLLTRLGIGGRAVYRQVRGYLCGGLSHADPRPMKYEDGTPIIENGRLFLTVSSRLEKGCFQSVLSWNPTLCDFRMEGAIFYDVGDGKCCDDVAASIVYDRRTKEWYVWYCSFSHGHVLARGRFTGDPRYGIQIIDTTLLPLWDGEDLTAFAGAMVSLNSSLSSDISIASGWVPTSTAPSSFSLPDSASSEQMFSAVCPPIPEMTPSTPSFSMMAATLSTVRGTT